MKSYAYCVLLIACYVCVDFSGATVCKPLSTFRVDCNMCSCSSSGQEYNCTQKICFTPGFDDFSVESSENGFVLLKPKPKKTRDEDFVLTGTTDHAKNKSGVKSGQ